MTCQKIPSPLGLLSVFSFRNRHMTYIPCNYLVDGGRPVLLGFFLWLCLLCVCLLLSLHVVLKMQFANSFWHTECHIMLHMSYCFPATCYQILTQTTALWQAPQRQEAPKLATRVGSREDPAQTCANPFRTIGTHRRTSTYI